MAIRDPVVVSSGSLLAAMLHQQACAPNDQDGFFLGKIESSVTDKISDAEIGEKEENLFINIYDFVPCPSTFYFYDNIGQIKNDSLMSLLNGKENDIVGWYKIRRNSSHRVSFREKAIHQSLSRSIPIELANKRRAFLFGLFTSESLHNGALFSTQHSFFIGKVGHFQVLKWKTSNLHSDEGTQYKHFNTSAVNRDEPTFKALINAVDRDTEPNNMLQRCTNFIEYFNKSNKDLREELMLKEERILSLDMEIENLEKMIPFLLQKDNSIKIKSKVIENGQMEGDKSIDIESVMNVKTSKAKQGEKITDSEDGTEETTSDQSNTDAQVPNKKGEFDLIEEMEED